MKLKRLMLGIALLLAARLGFAVSTNVWEFDDATDYVFDPELVAVTNLPTTRAELVLQADQLAKGERFEYTNVNKIVNIEFDEPGHVQLTGNSGSIPSNGVFTSRVIDADPSPGNLWQELSVVAAFADYVSDNDVTAYFKMDNDAWLDQVTRVRGTPGGTAPGGVTFTTDAAVGSHAGLWFGAPNAYNGRVAMPRNPYAGASGVTIAMRLKLTSYPDDLNHFRVAFGGFTSGSSFLLLRVGDGSPAGLNRLQFAATTTDGSMGVATAFPTNEYQFVIVTWDGANSDPEARRPRMYINGQLVAEGAPRAGTLTHTASLVHIGNDTLASQYNLRGWLGSIDELLVIRRGLPQEEVFKLFEGQSDFSRPVRVQVRSGPDESALEGRSFVGPDATTNSAYAAGNSTIGVGPDMVGDDRYLQYQVRLIADGDQRQTPVFRGVRFSGSLGEVRDQTFSDFQMGTFTTNTMQNPAFQNAPFLGLAKQSNGGYFTNGVYESRIFDAGEASQWSHLIWTPVSELPANLLGLTALWHLNSDWTDSKSTFSVFNIPNAAFTPFAKAGLGSATFNGADNFVSGFLPMGVNRAVEFWIKDENVFDEIMELAPGIDIRIANRQITVNGLSPEVPSVYVNAVPSAPHLKPGWNHVVVNLGQVNGVNVSSLTVGQIPGVGFMDGQMDELAFYDRELNTAEISAHNVIGQREVAGWVGFQVSDETFTNFVGPGGQPNNYWTVPGVANQAGNLLGGLSAQRFIRYRAVFAGDGDATPLVRNLRLITSAPTVQTFTDDTAAELYEGTRVSSASQVYGTRFALDDLSIIGPTALTPVNAQVFGLWHFDDQAWTPTVVAAVGTAGQAFGNARPSFGARVGLRAGLFDGAGDYVRLLQTVVGMGTNDFSLSLWVKTSAAASAPLLSLNHPSQYAALRMVYNPAQSITGSVALVVNDGTGEKSVVSRRGYLFDNQWHHVVGIRNRNQLLIYVDGRNEGGRVVTGLGNCGGSLEFWAADTPGSTNGPYFRGQLDEISMHGRAIAEAEIGENYAGLSRTSVRGELQSETFSRSEPAIWQTLAWVPMGPFSKPLSLSISETRLVGLWHLDEFAGTLTNAVGGGLIGTTPSGATYRAPGRFDRALDLDGAGQYVQVAHGDTLEPITETLTIEAWVYMDRIDDRYILSKRNGSNGYALFTDANGLPVFWVGNASVSGSLQPRIGKWTHIAGVYTGTRLRLYMDGTLQATGNTAGTLASGANLLFGRSHAAGSHFDGRLDEVAVHTRPLGGEEILDHYRAGAVTAKFQARSANTNVFVTPFVGPDGTTNTFFTDGSGSKMPITAIPAGHHFEYRGIFETEDFRYPPDTRGLSVFVSGYPASNPTVYPTSTNGFNFLGHIQQFSHLRVPNPNTDVRYQISGDSGDTPRWFFFDTPSRRWAEFNIGGGSAYEFQSSSVSEVDTNIVSFYTQIYNKTGGVFRFRAFLHSMGEQQAALDWVRVVVADGRITVLAPDGTENGEKAWLVGVPYDISWERTTTVMGTINIEFNSSPGGNSFVPLAPPAPTVPVTAGSYLWTTPGTPTTNGLIRITVNNDPTINDRSDRTFTLRHGLQIAEHNGGTNIWYVGETNIIRWRKSSNAFAGHLEFSPDGVFTGGQARITTVVTGNDVTNSFAWVTPFNNPKFVSEAGRLCVTNPAPNPTRHGDVSDETFVLAGGVFTGPQPAQGVKKDAAFDVQWVSAGMGPTVRLEVQAQPGGPWSLIDDAVPNISGLNTYAWTPTNAPTGGARLRLQSNSDPRAIGLSDLFSIAAVELVSPVGQENQDFTELWLQNTTNNITWTSGGASGFVNLSYSVDGGLTFTTISNNVPNVNSDLFVVTNVYSWVVAPFPTKLARVRIEDASDPTNLFDISTYDFKIAGLRVSFPDLATDSMEVRVEGPIQWDENDVGSLGTVQFSENGGATWQLVESGPILGTRQSLFTPTNPTLRGLVRIIADAPAPFTNVFDLSNSEFPVRGIRVAAPQQGGLYTIGTTNPITFVIAATFDADFRAQIYYAEDGFSFDRDNPLNGSFSFVDGIANTFSWIVEPSRRPSQSGRIMVESGPSGTPYSGVSEDFVLRGVKFDTPSAGAVWAPGTNEISWAVAGIANGATANILLSLAGGAPGTFTNTIVSGAAVDAFTANWVVPLGLGPSTSARLRFDVVSSPAGAFDTQYFADSDIFTLLGIRVLSPLGSSRWDMGTTQTITWDSASGGNRVDLLYSADGGVTFDPRPIAANVVSQNGTNSLSWAIDFQRTPSSNAVVRVASRSVPGLSGDSAPFYVRGIKINRPSGADIYASTDPTNLIQWVAANDTPTPFTIRYVKEAEAPVQIATDLAATNRIYNWAFPPLAAVSDNVRIEITDGIHTSTSSVFRIVSVATIQVISPSAGDFWEVGSTRQLQWSRGGFMPNDFTVYLVLSPYDATNAPLSVGAVAFDETNNVFSFSWEVPDNPGKGKIVVKHNTLSTVEDDSGEFSIVGKFEILNPPGPFDIYAMKPNTLVRWRTRGSVPFVDLYYSINENRDDWTKVNAAPIPNNNKPFNPGDVEGSWSISTYDWTVPNARVDAAAIRVQEALYTQEFAPTDTGPFDDSAEFPIYYYSIVWDVYDVVSGNALNSPTGRLDRLSVVDSSGWGQSDASAIPPNRLVNDYPWGSFNTEIYREGFFDRSILFWSSENTAISVPGPRAWTQRVVMVRSQITEEYHVLANFSYDANSTNFTINAWMERGGVILEQPTSCAVKIYDASGNTIDVIESATPSSGGVFWVYWDASGQPRGAVFFAKVEIIYSGSVYSSGLTFTLTIPLSDEFGGAIDDLKNAIGTNILESVGNVLTNVADLIDRVQALQGTTSSGFSNLTDLARITTNLLGEVRGDVKVLTNEVISVLGPKVDQLTNVITTIGLQTLARILSRPEAVAAGSTNSMLFKSKAGYATAQMAVVPLDGGGSPGPFTLNEVGGVGGLYEAPYIANWGLGRYRVTVSDPQGSSDSIVMRIVSGDLYDLPVQLGDFSNKLESIESQLINMSVASAAITNELLPLISGLSSNLATLTTNTAVDFAYIQEQVGFLTNGLATLTVLDEIADDIARLTNSLASVTNISDLVFQLTNALAGVSAGDIAAIGRGVDRLTNSFWNADWGTVMAIDSNVTRMTNAMFAMDGMVFDLDRVTQSLHNIDFARIQAGVIDTTNRLSALTGLAEISDQIRSLSNSLAQISALTNIAPTIAALGTNLLPINFQSMSQNITNIANTLAGVAGLDALANQIGQLSNSLSQISAVTNLSGSMSLLTNALLPINFAQMAADISSATGSLSALNGLDALAESLNGISNSLAAIGGIGNMTNQVHALYTNLQAANLGRMASDLGYATNRLSLLSSVPNQLNLLSNQLVGVSRDVGTVTNRLAQFDWGVITNIQALSMQTYTNIQTLENLADVARDLQNLTNAIAQLSGITNVGADVADITNALQGLNWADVLFIKTNVMIITNQLTALRDIGAISNSIAQLTNSIQQLTVLTNMPGQVGQIAAAVVGVDFRGLTNDVKNILTQVNQIDWNDILAVRSDLQYTTNVLAGLNDLPALLTAINGLTNATADLAQLGSFSTQLNAIAGAVVGVNFAKMYGDVVSVTSSLATAQINLLPGMQSTLVSISNLLAGLDLSTVTNLGVVVDTLSSNLTAVNWADIVELQSDMRTVTNTLAGLDELDGVILALNGLSNSLPALASVTNLGTQVGEIVDAIAGLTNALDWTDITDIQTNVHGLVTDLAALDTALAALQGLTNGLGGVGDLTNMQVQLSVLTNQLYGADWSDIRTLQRDMAVVTNSLGDIGALVGLGAQIDTLITTVEGVGVLTNTFATADWGDITVIDNSLRALSASLEGLAGVDLTSFDPQSNVRIESTLQSMASVDVVSQIALLMGTVQDTESDASFFGRLAAMQNKLSLVGVDAKNASLRSQNAKTKASAAAGAIQALQSDIEEGDVTKVMSRVHQIQGLLKETSDELARVPTDVDPATLNTQVRQMADAVNRLAASKGFERLLNFSGEAEGDAAGGGMDKEDAKDLNLKIQELRDGMAFLKQLMDEMRYEPVVQESLLGVE